MAIRPTLVLPAAAKKRILTERICTWKNREEKKGGYASGWNSSNLHFDENRFSEDSLNKLTKKVSKRVPATEEFPEDIFWVAECELIMEMISIVEVTPWNIMFMKTHVNCGNLDPARKITEEIQFCF